MTAIFWLLVGMLAATYVGYPALIAIMSKSMSDKPVRADVSGVGDHGVDLVLPVHNEEANLPGKLQNILDLDYPRELLRIYVVSDGSTDRTVDILTEAASKDSRIHVITLPNQQGKEAALNLAVSEGDSPVIVFTDAALTMHGDSLRQMAGRFHDPGIGCVSGEDTISGQEAEGFYGRYELALRRNEGRICSIVGASGCLYAQRRSLWRPFTPGLAPDFTSVLDVVDLGFKAVSEPGAKGYMPAANRQAGEFRRKSRTILRGIATLWAYRRMLNPARTGMFSLLLWGHKVLRWLVPVWLVLLLIVSALLSRTAFYAIALATQCLFYLIGIMASTDGSRLQESTIPKVASYFTISNAAAIFAILQWLAGKEQTSWKPTIR